MDLFRKSKKKNDHSTTLLEQLDQIAIAATEEADKVSTDPPATMAVSPHTDEQRMMAIDVLVDSDEDITDIFDDDEEDDEDDLAPRSPASKASLASVNSSRSSNYSAQAYMAIPTVVQSPEKPDPDGSRASLHDEVDNDHSHEHDDDDSEDQEDETLSDHDRKSGASESGEDYTDDEDEGEDGYKPGGYHPVKVGEIYNQRYVTNATVTLVQVSCVEEHFPQLSFFLLQLFQICYY